MHGHEMRVVRRIPGAKGELIDKTGASVNVQFSLTQWQKYVDSIPGMRSAGGSIKFGDMAQAWAAMDGELRTLRGGGIEAKVFVVSSDGEFKVTGPVNEI